MSGGWYEDGSEEAEKILTARLEHGRVNDKIGKNMPRSTIKFVFCKSQILCFGCLCYDKRIVLRTFFDYNLNG